MRYEYDTVEIIYGENGTSTSILRLQYRCLLLGLKITIRLYHHHLPTYLLTYLLTYVRTYSIEYPVHTYMLDIIDSESYTC